MAKIENRKKQNPKLQQSELSDGRASLYLEYYIPNAERIEIIHPMPRNIFLISQPIVRPTIAPMTISITFATFATALLMR